MNAQKETNMIAELLGVPQHHVCLVGSRLICGEGHDTDLLVLSGSELTLIEAGYHRDLEDALYEDTAFVSWRKGDMNVLLTSDPQYFAAEVAIAYAAQAIAQNTFDMSDRDGRVAFHSLVRSVVAPHIAPAEVFDL